MKTISLDPAAILNIEHRSGREASRNFIFKHQDGTPFDITEIDFQMLIKKWDQSEVISLTIDNGLTIEEENKLTFELSEDQRSIAIGKYFWELINKTSVKTWINGDFTVHNGKHDSSVSSTEVTIVEDGEDIVITIEDSAGGNTELTTIDGGTP